MRLLLLSVMSGAFTLSAENWQKINAGPFEIYTSGEIQSAKNLLGTLEQMRGQLADLAGLTDPKPIWPIRIVISKGQRPGNLTHTTAVHSLLLGDAAIAPQQKMQICALLLETNAGPLERSLEQALLTILSTIESERVRVTIGALPPRDLQTADWVLLQYLITSDVYRARVRVLLSNLMRGNDKSTAIRNAFEKDDAPLRQEAAAARPAFAPVTFSARPILPERDFRARDIEVEQGRLQLAIAQLGDPNLRDTGRRVCSAKSTEFEAQGSEAQGFEAQQCVAAAYALAGQADLVFLEAEKALKLNAQSPRMLFLAATSQPDRLKHQQLLFTALQLKPVYPEAASAFASKENDPQKAFQYMKSSSVAAQRNVAFLSQMAKVAQAAEKYPEEAKAWAAAERSAFDPVEKEALRESRLGAQDRRYEAEAQARREAEAARIADIERVRQDSLRRVREAEAKARGGAPLDENQKVEQWWEGEQPSGTLTGQLIRIDCLSAGRARFTIRESAKKLTLLDVADLSKLNVTGAGKMEFACGAQKAPLRLKAGFKDRRLLAVEILP